MKTIAFFNSKGGIGKTSLVYHLAWMFADNRVPTLAVDLDPQANLTTLFLDAERLETLWPDADHPDTVYGSIHPILGGIGDIVTPHVAPIAERLSLIPGDLGLSRFEDKFSDAWSRCHNRDESAYRTLTTFHRLIQAGTDDTVELVLIDVGPNLGAINRSALIASDQICIPLAPDLFSLQSLRNLGPTLRDWRVIWGDLAAEAPTDLPLPKGRMQPIGYILMQHGLHGSRSVLTDKHWMDRIPAVYREAVLNETVQTSVRVEQDPHCLSLLRHHHGLMTLAMEARKPMFCLKSADGAIGAHIEAIKSCYRDFHRLASRIATSAGIVFPSKTMEDQTSP